MVDTRLGGLKSSTAIGLAAAWIGTASYAGPTGGEVVGGNATISTPDASTTVVDQTSQRGIVDWQTLDVGSGEQLRFNQPETNSITLNRVTGGQGPSAIDGRIDANGRIIISNRDGIVFGDGARIDVGALIATTADIENDAFMRGSLGFNRSGSATGQVINHGTISARDGGLIALVAPHAENKGILSARVGRIAVAGGDRFTVDFSGSEFLRLAIDPDSPAAQYLAKNSGQIAAEGGHVLLTTQTASDALSGVVNNSGVVEATAVDTSGGRIRLVAGGGATVRNSGTVRSRGTTGGTIELTAERVELTSGSLLDASGDEGGGTVLVGGDYLGGNEALAGLNPLAPPLEAYPLYNATATIAETGAVAHADALNSGDGGKVILWSNEYTVTGATITARGGLSFGDGGFVETSGGTLDVRTAADTSALNGSGGTWLLDPRDITIVDGVTSVADVILSGDLIIPDDDNDTEVSSILIEARLNAGERVVVTTLDTPGSEAGDIFVEGDIVKSRGGDAELWLIAEDDIIIRSGVDIESNSNEMNIVLSANDEIRAGNMGELDTNGGELALRSGDDIEIDTRSRLPDIGILSIPAEAASRVDVELDFEDDHIEFTYTDDELEVPTGGFELLEFSGGEIVIALEGGARDLIINDRSFLLNDGRGDDVNFENIDAYGTSDSNALNGIPEVINFQDVVGITNLGNNPPNGIAPVIEVSTDEGLSVDVLVPTSPEGQSFVDGLNEPEPEPAPEPEPEPEPEPQPEPEPAPEPEPQPEPEPEPPVEEPTDPEPPEEEPSEPEPPVDEPSDPEPPAEEPSDPPSSEDEPEETPGEPPVVEEEPESDEPVGAAPPTVPPSNEPTFLEGIVIAVMEPIVSFVNGDPSDEIEEGLSENAKTDILEIIKVTNTLGSGLDAATEGQLSSLAESYGYSWWEVFGNLVAATEVVNHLIDGKVADAFKVAGKWAGEDAIKDTLAGTAILKASKTSSAFTLIVEYGLNQFNELVQSVAFEYQRELYFQARNDGYSHEDILSQNLDPTYNFSSDGFFEKSVLVEADGTVRPYRVAAIPSPDYSGLTSAEWEQKSREYASRTMDLFELMFDATDEKSRLEGSLTTAIQKFQEEAGGT